MNGFTTKFWTLIFMVSFLRSRIVQTIKICVRFVLYCNIIMKISHWIRLKISECYCKLGMRMTARVIPPFPLRNFAQLFCWLDILQILVFWKSISQVYQNIPYVALHVTSFVMVYTLIDHSPSPISTRETSQLWCTGLLICHWQVGTTFGWMVIQSDENSFQFHVTSKLAL